MALLKALIKHYNGKDLFTHEKVIFIGVLHSPLLIEISSSKFRAFKTEFKTKKKKSSQLKVQQGK